MSHPLLAFLFFNLLQAPWLPRPSSIGCANLGCEPIAEKRHALSRRECLDEEDSMTIGYQCLQDTEEFPLEDAFDFSEGHGNLLK
jgi:hypothetical protein